MAGTRDLIKRQKSIKNMAKVTNVMEMIASMNLNKAKVSQKEAKKYGELLYDIGEKVLKTREDIKQTKEKTTGVIVITSNRGLAGGFHLTIMKYLREKYSNQTIQLYFIGKKGCEISRTSNINVKIKDYSLLEYEEIMENVDAQVKLVQFTQSILDDYKTKQVDKLDVVSMRSENMVIQRPKRIPILDEDEMKNHKIDEKYEYDGEKNEIKDLLEKSYLMAIIYAAIKESKVCEYFSRMQTMHSAGENAKEMLENLERSYHKVRQAAITRELTEIVAGAQALE